MRIWSLRVSRLRSQLNVNRSRPDERDVLGRLRVRCVNSRLLAWRSGCNLLALVLRRCQVKSAEQLLEMWRSKYLELAGKQAELKDERDAYKSQLSAVQ